MAHEFSFSHPYRQLLQNLETLPNPRSREVYTDLFLYLGMIASLLTAKIDYWFDSWDEFEGKEDNWPHATKFYDVLNFLNAMQSNPSFEEARIKFEQVYGERLAHLALPVDLDKDTGLSQADLEVLLLPVWTHILAESRKTKADATSAYGELLTFYRYLQVLFPRARREV